MGCFGDEDEDEDEDGEILQPLLHPNHSQNLTSTTLDLSPNTSPGALGGDDFDTVISPMNSNFAALICRDILHPNHSQNLTSTTLDLSPNTSPGALGGDDFDTVISPMNSNFAALICRDILRTILEKLPLADLARAACVCRLWSLVASDREIQTRAFMAPWKLKDVVGNPSSGSFWRDSSVGRFAISHRLIRQDTVASLAVKYSVQVMDIKRLNNMMSDHGIYSRERLLIPVSKPDLLINGICYIELDTYAKREVAVLYLEGAPDRKLNSLLNGRVSSDRGKRRVIDSLKRSMQVDDGTAEYYLSLSNGDPRAALTEFSEDLRWERQVGLT